MVTASPNPVCKLLEEIGISDFDPQQLIEARRSTYFEDFQRALKELDRDFEPEQTVRIGELGIRLGSIALSSGSSESTNLKVEEIRLHGLTQART